MIFLATFHNTTLVNMRFCTHVPNSTMNKNVKSNKPYLRPKMVFLPPKHCCTSQAQWKKTFSLTLNLMISQMVRNECLRFGGHVGIQVSYKILRLEVLKDFPFLVTSPCPGYLWGRPPARPIRLIDLRARPIRVKRALIDRPW
jgi:hypothetical protein